MNMHAHRSAKMALALLIALAGCTSETPAPPANSSPSTSNSAPQTPPDRSASSIDQADELLLNDQYAGPNADAPAVTDETAVGEDALADNEPDDLDDDADMPDEQSLAKGSNPLVSIDDPAAEEFDLVYVPTTSISATGQYVASRQEIAERNERLRNKRRDAEAAEAAAAKSTGEPAPATSQPASTATTVADAAANKPASSTPTAAPAAPVDEKKILGDKHGQWATTAKASSTYAQSTDAKAGYSPWQATGAPNVDRYSDSPLAWTTKSGDAKDPEWLEVGFAKPVHATSIRIRQTAAPGAIARIELIDDASVAHTIWEGTDETQYAKDTIGWFVRDVPKTAYVVKGARITLQTARVWGWNEIDAVQLVGEP